MVRFGEERAQSMQLHSPLLLVAHSIQPACGHIHTKLQLHDSGHWLRHPSLGQSLACGKSSVTPGWIIPAPLPFFALTAEARVSGLPEPWRTSSSAPVLNGLGTWQAERARKDDGCLTARTSAPPLHRAREAANARGKGSHGTREGVCHQPPPHFFPNTGSCSRIRWYEARASLHGAWHILE